MARKTKEESEETRRLLLDAALKLFSEKGIQNTTLAAVAKEAGVTRGAIYWHFKDKADMLHALWEVVLGPLDQVYESLFAEQEKDPLDYLLKCSTEFLLEVVNNPKFQQVMRISMQSMSDQQLCEHMRCHCQNDLDNLTKVMGLARKKGILRQGLSPKTAAFCFMGYMAGILETWLNNKGLIDLEQEIHSIGEVIVRGLRR